MRVLRVLTRPNVGGPTRQAVALWHAHRAQGVQTLLVVGRCADGEARVPLHAFGLPVRTRAELAAAGSGDAAVGVMELPTLRRAPHPGRDALAVRGLRQLIERFRPDIVHTHTSKAGVLGRRAARHARVAVAHTYHGHVLHDYFPRPLSAAFRRIEQRLARRTDLLCAVSPSCAAELQALGFPAMTVVPPAVADLPAFAQTSRADARAHLNVPAEGVALGFVGRLVPIKQPRVFVEVVDQVAQRVPGLAGYVFGDGPERARLLRQPGASRLRLFGAVGDLSRSLAALDVLVLPSRREGCPLAAIEAFAAGVPVVGFDVAGVRDALRDWGAGVLVPPAAGAPGLARAVAELLADPARRVELVRQARAGLTRFEPERVAAQLVRCYRDAVAHLPTEGVAVHGSA